MNAPRADRIALSILFSFIASIISFLLVAVAPFFMEELWYGTQNVYESPAHGAAIFILSVPTAGVLSLLILMTMPFLMYRKLTPRNTPPSNQA